MPGDNARYWCFTYYGISGEMTISTTLPKEATYCVYQKEKCPTTNREHIQGYIEFSKPTTGGQRSKWVKEFVPGAHTEEKSRFSTREEAEHYCCKPCGEECQNKHCVDARQKNNGRVDWRNTKPTMLGVQHDADSKKTRATQGQRTDLEDAVRLIDGGSTVKQVIQKNPKLVKYISHLNTYRNSLTEALERDVEVIVLWGDAGTGKSIRARADSKDYYNKPMGDWWDNYTGQKTLILDDYNGYLQYTELLRVLDRYAYQVPVKGGFVWAQWNKVYITSNKDPLKWYKSGMTKALFRRIKSIELYRFIKGEVRIADDKIRVQNNLLTEENDESPSFTPYSIFNGCAITDDPPKQISTNLIQYNDIHNRQRY